MKKGKRATRSKGSADPAMSTSFVLSSINHSNPKPPLSGTPPSSSTFRRKSKRRTTRKQAKTPRNNNDDEDGGDSTLAEPSDSTSDLCRSPETLVSLTSQIERLESLNISSKLYEAEVQRRLHDEQERHKADLADAAAKAHEARATMFKVQDSNFNLSKELNAEKKHSQALAGQITYQHDMFLNVLAKQKMKHVYEMQMGEANDRRRANQDALEQLEVTMIENETMSEEVMSLRASILQLSEVIEHLEYDNLELQFHLKKVADAPDSASKRPLPTNGTPPPPTLSSPKLSSPALDTTERVTKKHRREIQRKKEEKYHNKVEVKSFIASWFSDAELEVKDQQKVSQEEVRTTGMSARSGRRTPF